MVAAGERWPDGSLRPAAEDLWGAGAVLARLASRRPVPRGTRAADAFRAVEAVLADRLHGCASGLELVAAGFGEDVDVAAELDVSDVVPVLADGSRSLTSRNWPYPAGNGFQVRASFTGYW